MSAMAQFRLSNDGSADAALLAAALEACPENLAIVDSGCVIHANRSFAETLGYSYPSELEGLPLSRFIPANQLSAFAPPVMEEGQNVPSSHSRLSVFRKDGSPLRVQPSSVRFQAGERQLLVLSLRVCPVKEPQFAPAKHSPQMESLGYLVGAVAHDFNNLLTGILLYCDLLVAGLDPHNPLRTYVAEIRRAGGHSAELIQQLMAVARPPQAEPSVNSWRDVISGQRTLLTRLLGENVQLQIDGSGESGEEDSVRMDAVPMRQILLNLLLNARDAMPAGGRITLSVRNCAECRCHRDAQRTSACTVLVVADTGSGMDAETRSRLFQTFFTTKRGGQGNGLGLATVDRIVKQHGGTVQVESQPGQGTRIGIHLPRARPLPAKHSNPKGKECRGNSL
jgi:PAS domain S-box-containing protein